MKAGDWVRCLGFEIVGKAREPVGKVLYVWEDGSVTVEFLQYDLVLKFPRRQVERYDNKGG